MGWWVGEWVTPLLTEPPVHGEKGGRESVRVSCAKWHTDNHTQGQGARGCFDKVSV